MKKAFWKKMLTITERLMVSHYVKHGDQKCEGCQKGYQIYWNGHRHV